MAPTTAAAVASLAAEAEARVESRIDAALTPEVLSRLAFKGVTPEQARDYLRRRVALQIAREFGL
jgi:hypothetical protein